MKKILLSLLAIAAFALNSSAQGYYMVVTHEDGTVDSVMTTAVKNVSFSMVQDQNAEQVIIKELYNGGCPKDVGTGYFQQDKGCILYNNSNKTAVLNNLCFGIIDPYNSQAPSNDWYDANGALRYESEGYIPATGGMWWFQQALVIKPYSQVVISFMGSIDNTQTHSQSVNYANKDYYCMYDPEAGFNNKNYYPSPSEIIPTSHYLKGALISMQNAWAVSVSSPAFMIFQTKDSSPAAFAANADNEVYAPKWQGKQAFRCLKVPREWVLDGIEIFTTSSTENKKRFTSDIDAGSVFLTNKLGHTLYRNVNKAATEALPENAGKLVTGYAKDPSGIDAEASIKNGAHIIYMDTNNSTNDFHERDKFSIRN